MVHAMCLLAEHIDNNTPVEEKMQVFFFVLFKRQYGNTVSHAVPVCKCRFDEVQVQTGTV